MSSSYNNSINDLKQLQQTIHSIAAYMKNEVEHEDAHIFMGSTKSGKSTLINYLIGNKLMGEKVTELFSKCAIKKVDNSPGPSIGIKSTSETVYPTRWKSRPPLELTIWDVPGFDDNRGIIQDITNAFYIYELFQNLKSAKIVLVIDINDIVQDNTRPFLNLLNSVEKLLKGKMEECFGGIAFVFSKVPQETFQMKNYKEIITRSYLENKFLLSAIDISPGSKSLIHHIIGNEKKIGFFKQGSLAEVDKYITDININEGIFEAIQNTSGINEEVLKQVSPSITEKSQLFLHEVREQLRSTPAFIELQILIRNIFNENIPDYNEMRMKDVSQESLLQQYQNLKIFKNKLIKSTDLTISLDKKLDAVRMLDPSIEKLIYEHSLLEAAKLMKFIDKLWGWQDSKDFENKLQSLLITALSNINELIINLKLKLNKMTAAEADAKFSEVVQKYKEEREKLNSEIEAVKKNNAVITENIHQQLKTMIASQSKKDQEFSRYFDELKRVQEALREKKEKEMQKAEERLRELEREAERKEQEREWRAEMRERERKKEEEERRERERRERRERREWKMEQEERKEERERKRDEDERKERKRKQKESDRKKKDKDKEEKEKSDDRIEITVKLPNPFPLPWPTLK